MPRETFFNLPEAKRQRILSLALEEFAGHDYRSASISRLVVRAGIAKGSFYQYFEDKRDLYLYLIDLAVQEKKAFFQQNPPPDPEAGTFDHLRWLFERGLAFEFSNPHLARIGYRAVYGDAPLPVETARLVRAGSLEFFRSLVVRGIDRGDLRPDLDPDLAAFVFQAVFGQLGDELLARQGVPPEALLERGGRALAGPDYRPLVDSVLSILEIGMGRPKGSDS